MELIASDIEKQLTTIVHQLLIEMGNKYSERKITLTTSLQSHLGIDSLGRAELFQRIEKVFGIKFPDRFIAEASTLEDIAKTISTTPLFSPTLIQTGKLAKPNEEVWVDRDAAKTLIDVLLLYVAETPDRPHLLLQDEQGKETSITYRELLETSQCVASALLALGLETHDTVAIMQPSVAGFFYAFMGTLLAGGIPVPIYPPFRLYLMETYAKQEATILRNAEVKFLVTFQEAKNVGHLLSAFVPTLKKVVTVDQLLECRGKAPIFMATKNHHALIQYTSGSTSTPKGVLLTHANLLSNIRAYGKAIQMSSKDVAVSWLPLYHDLGLIGKWLGSLYCGAPLVLFSPTFFLNRPERWLWAIHYHRGSISAGPNFAFELCAKKIDPATIEGLDLSSWRIAICGAELVHPNTIERFTKKFSAYGFKPDAFLPVYGLAESALGLTVPPLGRLPLIDKIERSTFENKRLAIPVQKQTNTDYLEFVSCGKPLEGHHIRIVNEQQQELPDRQVGHLQFQGPSCLESYYRNPQATAAIYHDGWWASGDLAYRVDGEIYITGRQKDVIIKAGRNLSPTEIEGITAQIPGIRPGCSIAFSVVDEQKGTEKLVIVAEKQEKKAASSKVIIEQINAELINLLNIAADEIILIPAKTIPKTSSGKLQRSACKQAYLEGKLGKKSLPTWMQIIKISTRWLGVKSLNLLAQCGHFIFSLYIFSIFSLTLLPVLLGLFLLPQRVGMRVCKVWIKFLTIMSFCPVKIKGKENLTAVSPLIFVANHTSYLDAMMLMSILPLNTRLVGKKELLRAPIVGTFMKKLGCLALDREQFVKEKGDTHGIENALREGCSILFFPEGTFAYLAGLRPFKLGAFQIAATMHVPICPIAINGTRKILRGKEKILRPHSISITIQEPITSPGSEWVDMIHLKDQAYEKIAAYCGEPTLDLIIATSTSASKKRVTA